MNQNCIINVACRKPYTDYQERLVKSIAKYSTPIIYWTDQYPPGSRTHHQSLYGFKVYAFKEAFRMGFENALWLDSPCYLLSDPSPIFEQIQADGHYLISTETPLWQYCNNRTIEAFNISRKDVKDLEFKLLSGSFIGLNKGSSILFRMEVFEKENFFYSASDDASQVKEFEGDLGHRHDESVLSMLAYKEALMMTNHWDSHFQNDKAIVKSEKW